MSNIIFPDIVSRKPFNLQEAVVLLDVYLSYNKSGAKNTEAAKIASERLRHLAQKNGLNIDTAFRSPMGIQNRLRSIGHIFEEREAVSAPSTQVFREAVDLFKNNYNEYERILSDAFSTQDLVELNHKSLEERKLVKMDEQLKSTEQEFFIWMTSNATPSAVEDTKRSLSSISLMLTQKKVLPQSLIATYEIEQVETATVMLKTVFGSKKMRAIAQKILNYYADFLRYKQGTELSKSEIGVQEGWIQFDFNNSALFERTVPAYCSFKGYEIAGKNWARILVGLTEYELSKNNPALEPLYKQSLLGARKDRPFLLKNKLEGLNCSELSNGFWINVNYSIPRLLDQIQALCLNCGYIKNDVTIYGVAKGDASKIKPVEPKKGTGNGVNIEKAESYLLNLGLAGATVHEIIDAVQPGAAVFPTRSALDTNANIIGMPNGRYVHAEAFVDLDEAEEDMRSILKTHFVQFGGYSNSKLLFGAAAHDLSMFLNDNDCEDIDSVYSLAQYFFAKKSPDDPYVFSFPHIFEKSPDFPLTLKGLMINLARANGGILHVDDAKNYLQKTMLTYGGISQLLQLSSSDTFLYYDENRFLLTEKVGIDSTFQLTLHDKLDSLFRQADVAYVIPRDIADTWLHTLPALPQGLPWTALLLQEVLRNYPDVGFKPITSELGQAATTIAAAIVPSNSALQSFPDVVTLYMQGKYALPKRMPCEDLRQELREAGMLEGNELIYALPKALDDFRFSWTDENKTVLVRGN